MEKALVQMLKRNGNRVVNKPEIEVDAQPH